jgi:hypothetical protein
MKYGNRLVFMRDLEKHLEDLSYTKGEIITGVLSFNLLKSEVISLNHQCRARLYCTINRVSEWLRSLTLNHLPLTTVGSNFDRDFGFFHVRKLSS